MEKEGPFTVCDSDSSDSLPELFPKHTFDITKLTKNDIVWAEYKDLCWPALVRDVDKKNKKVKVWYLDSPGKIFKVPFKKIHDFVDSDFRKKVEDEAKLHSLGQKHAEVLRRTDLYIFTGDEDDPLEFFDFSKPYFALKDLNPKIAAMKSNCKNESTEKVDVGSGNLKESSGESLVDSDEESHPSSKCLPVLPEEDSPYDDETVDKILSFITSGHVDNYLIDIVNSKIANERHESYVKAVKNNSIQMFEESQPSVPIKSQQLHSVSIYLHGLYKQKIGKEELKMNEYIVSVWLPEAVNKAISLIGAEILKLPDVSCNNKELSLPSEVEASCSVVASSSKKLSSSLISLDSSEFSMENGNKVSCLPTEESFVDSDSIKICSSEEEASKSPVDASKICGPKRKLHLRSSLVNPKYCEVDNEEHASNKKKSSGRKKQKKSSTASSPEKKTPQKMDKPRQGSLIVSIPKCKISLPKV